MLINEDLSLYNSFTCNNGAQIDVQNNKIKLKNISTDTLCKTSNSIKTITDNIDDSENYILVLNDEIINDWIYIGKNKRLTIDLYGHNIIGNMEYDSFINSNDDAIVTLKDTIGTGKISTQYRDAIGINGKNIKVNINVNIEAPRSAVRIYASGENTIVNINGGNINCTSTSDSCIYSTKINESFNINNAKIVANNAGVITYGPLLLTNSSIDANNTGVNVSSNSTIKNTIITSHNDTALAINNTDRILILDVYDSELSSSGANFPTLHNSNTTDDGTSEKIINIYNTKIYHSYINYDNGGTWRQSAIRNELGTININGGEYISEASTSIYNNKNGTINIIDGIFKSNNQFNGLYSIVHNNGGNAETLNGVINICNATLLTDNNNSDLTNGQYSTIKYKSGIKWVNGNSPVTEGVTSNILLDDTITCK